MAILRRNTIYDERFFEDLMRKKEYLDQNSRENWFKREIEEAFQKGLAEGREIGRLQVYAEEAKKTLLQNIKGLLKIGIDEQTIKKGLNCTDEQIKEAKAN